MGAMKEKNRREWRSPGWRGDRSEHDSAIRSRYADPPHDESVRARWRRCRGNDRRRTDCGGGRLLSRMRLAAKDRDLLQRRRPCREKHYPGDEEGIPSHTPILRRSETGLRESNVLIRKPT